MVAALREWWSNVVLAAVEEWDTSALWRRMSFGDQMPGGRASCLGFAPSMATSYSLREFAGSEPWGDREGIRVPD